MRDGAEGLPLDGRLSELREESTELPRVLGGDDEVVVDDAREHCVYPHRSRSIYVIFYVLRLQWYRVLLHRAKIVQSFRHQNPLLYPSRLNGIQR